MPIVRTFLFALALVLADGTAAWAQEGTPESRFDPTARFPVQIHPGTCEEPGHVAFELGEGGFGLPVLDDPTATPEVVAAQVGPADANPAIVLVALIDASLDQLTADSHVVNMHVAGEDPDASRFACGVVGGFRAANDLVFSMQEVNNSRYGGATWIHDLSDGSGRVTLFLTPPPREEVSVAAATETPGAGNAEMAEAARDTELSEANLPETSMIIRDGEIAAVELTLLEDIPTIVHVVNTDNPDYRFLIDELDATAPLPANDVIVLDFAVPSDGIYAARLLAAEADEELTVSPVTIVPR